MQELRNKMFDELRKNIETYAGKIEKIKDKNSQSYAKKLLDYFQYRINNPNKFIADEDFDIGLKAKFVQVIFNYLLNDELVKEMKHYANIDDEFKTNLQFFSLGMKKPNFYKIVSDRKEELEKILGKGDEVEMQEIMLPKPVL